MSGQGKGLEGGAEVEAASLLRAALATHPFSRDKGTEVLQWLLFSQTAVPAGGGGVEAGAGPVGLGAAAHSDLA